MSTLKRSLLAAASIVLLLAPAVVAERSRSVKATAPSTGRVVIENIAGRIDLEPTSGTEITVKAVVYAEGRNDVETEQLLDRMVWNEEGGSWGFTYPVDEYSGFAYPEEGGWGSTTSARFRGSKIKVYGRPRSGAPLLYVDMTLGVPSGVKLKVVNVTGAIGGGRLGGELILDTGRGDVELSEFDGRLDIDTGSGDVDVQQVTGRLRIDTGSGRVRVRNLDVRDLDIDTGSGDVRIEDGRAQRVVVDTGSGEIELLGVDVEEFDGDTGSGDVYLEGNLATSREIRVDTGSGDVTIIGGTAFEFDLRTGIGSGRVQVGYNDAELRRRDREIVGAIRGTGRTRVDVDTGSGDCRLRPGN